jgi:DNA polymerase-1
MKSLANIGISPNLVPALLTLSDGKNAPLKQPQAVRLLELYGSLGAALADVSSAPSTNWKRKLAPQKVGLLQKEEWLRVRPAKLPLLAKNINDRLIMDSKETAEALKAYGFYSLIRMLPLSNVVVIGTVPPNAQENDYRAIRNHADLCKLEECISKAKVCSIDTETSGKDPRSAILYGISFAVKEGQAFFVPMMKSDLDGLSPKDICTRLNKILTRRIKLIGHNLKYDFAVLQRNGINVQTMHFDTMLASYECFGDWDFWNLSAVAKKLLGVTIKRYRDIVDKGETFLDKPFKELVEHACTDADISFRLHSVLSRELRNRQIEKHFFEYTMRLEQLLLERECEGVRVDIGRLAIFSESIKKNANILRADAFAIAGSEFDIESTKATTEVLRGLGIWEKTTKILGDSQMEQIAGDFPVVKSIVKYRRERNRSREIEAISTETKNGRILVSFNQIKNAHGTLHTSSSNLSIAIKEGMVLDRTLIECFDAEDLALKKLVDVSNDIILRKDLKLTGSKGFIPDASVVENDKHGQLLLLVVIGESELAICRRFLIKKAQTLSLKDTIISRYQTLFTWLEDFKRTAILRGFAEYNGERKYLAGLQSSDIDRRNKAIRSAIRWLVRY